MTSDLSEGEESAPSDGNALTARAERTRRAAEAFGKLLELPPAVRRAKLNEVLIGDAVVLGDVERLLLEHEAIGSVVDTSAKSSATPVLDSERAEAGVLLSRYRLERRLGRGAMGEVWLAHDAQLERDVAIKIIRDSAELVGDRTARVRAIRESRAVARLDHPHVAGIFDVGETPAGALWIAMLYCPGGSLADRLRAGPMPPAEVMRVGSQLASALASAHEHGIVHRDVKPDNALIDSAGQIRLADFGIAKLTGAETELTHGVIGTLHYVAPEQVAGDPVDARSDLWALGVTLYELLTGHRPFSGPTDAALLHAILTTAPAPLPAGHAYPAQLTEVLTQLLQKEPSNRPVSASEVAQRLQATRSSPISRRSTAAADGAPRPRRRRAVLVAACGAAALLGWITVAILRRPADSALAGTAAAATLIEPSVAVLPFENTNRALADEPFVDGLTEEVISVLGRAPGIKVSSRTSTFALRGKGLNAKQLADTLGVEHLLEASVRREGDQLRVTARLIRASDGAIRWSDQYDRQLREIFRLQGEIAAAIATALQPSLSGAETFTPTLQRGTADLVAYEHFLEGRYQRAQLTAEGLRAAADQFRQAIRRDSLFARAWGSLANTLVLQSVFADSLPLLVMPIARDAALRAIAIDSAVAEGHAALAHVHLVFDFDWNGAVTRAARARALDPVNETRNIAGALSLLNTRRLAEARQLLEAARSRDVLEVSVLVTLGRVELEEGQIRASIALFEKAIAINPTFAYGHEQLGYGLLAAKRNSDAVRAFRRAAALSGARDSAHLAYALAVTGESAAARTVINRLEESETEDRRLPALGMAVAYAGLGDADRAFARLERAWTERAAYLDGVAVMPGLKSLAMDRRWPAFLARMGLQPSGSSRR